MTTARRLWPLEGALMHSMDANSHLGGSGPITYPLPSFLIEHERGLVLFDTGLAPDAWEQGTRAVYGDRTADGYTFEFPPGTRLDQQIPKAGFALDDVTHVVLSHTHLDHTGGLYLFPKARFFASEVDWLHAYRPHPFFEIAYATQDLDRVRHFDWTYLTQDADLFGDGSIRIIQTPGHTPGHMSMMVALPSITIILAADLGHTQRNLAGTPCPSDLDMMAAWRSIQRVRQLAESKRARIWVSHDAGDWDLLGQGPLS